jgi:signal transduction histidine kinase
MARHRTLITYLAIYFFAIGTAIRYLSSFSNHPSLWAIACLLAAFVLLLAIEPWLSPRSHWYTHLYLAVQTGIIIALSLTTPIVDFFATLFLSLTLQAVHVFPLRTGFRWTGVFTVIMAILMFHGPGWSTGLPLVLVHAIAYFFVGSYVAIVRQAEIARQESQKLLAELQAAHQQLHIYTAQAEELAVVKERNRLARNLHDSVTQTIFTMTLTTEAARILFDRDPAQAAPQLDRLQELAKSALSEMRSLVFELRPTAVSTLGLIPALRHHITMLERQHGLIVALHVTGEPHLSDEQAQWLFRIIQEALNNVVKHAQVDKASVTLQFENGRILLKVKDRGQGFAPQDIHAKEKHMGLSSMRERVDMLGGTLVIDSRPGEGTCVTVEVTSINGGENNG